MKGILNPAQPVKNNNSIVYPGLNAAKGILIILVIITHSLPPGMLLYYNYLFHMPVFLAISGFLVKKSTLDKGLLPFLKRLVHRLLIPWIIASVLYLPYSLKGRAVSELAINDLLYPFYHLWYVPAYFLGVVLCYSVSRFKIPVIITLLALGCFTIFWYLTYRESALPSTELPLYWIGDKRFYCYLFFFLLGYSVRNRLLVPNISMPILILCVVVSFSGIVYLTHKHQTNMITGFLYLFFNTSLVLLMIIHIAPMQWLQYKLFLDANKNSLGIYLYHPLIIFFIYRLLNDPKKLNVSNIQGLGIGIITLISILLIIRLIQQFNLANKYLLGISKTAVKGENEIPKAIQLNSLTS